MRILVRLRLGFIWFSIAACSGKYVKPLETEEIRTAVSNFAFFDLADYTKFQWDKMYAFAPYTPSSYVKSVVHRTVKSDIDWNEGVILLVFCQNGEVVAHMDFPRTIADFSGLGRAEGVSRSRAQCKIEKQPSGYGAYVSLRSDPKVFSN